MPLPDQPNAPLFLAGARLARFEALQRRLVPRAARFTEDERGASRQIVEAFLGRQPAKTRRKLALFLFVIDLVAMARGLGPFRALGEARQERLLGGLFDSRVGLLRKGFWGLNTLARLGVYGQTTLHAEIGYRVRENPGE